MTNVKMSVQGNKLFLEIDLSQEHGLSSTGKSITVAGTGGFVPVVPGIALNLNVCKKAAKTG